MGRLRWSGSGVKVESLRFDHGGGGFGKLSLLKWVDLGVKVCGKVVSLE